MIDVLLATYNGEKYLEALLDSILGQSVEGFRLLIRDDGSTDGTAGIIRRYANDYPSKIFLMEGGSHLGINSGFNELMKNSEAEYVMFSDQDDVWLPDKMKTLLDVMTEAEGGSSGACSIPVLVHSDLKVVGEGLGVIAESFFKYIGIDPSVNRLNRLLVKNTVTGCTVMANRKLLELSLPLPEGVYFYDYYLAITAKLFGAVKTVMRPLVLYRQHSRNDVGASKPVSLNVRKIAGKIKNTGLRFSQAYAVYEKFEGMMDESDGEVLRQFISLREKNFFSKIATVYRYRFFSQGILNNLGFLASLLLKF